MYKTLLIFAIIFSITNSCTNRNGKKKLKWAEDSLPTEEIIEHKETGEILVDIDVPECDIDNFLLHDFLKDNTQLLSRDGYITLYDYETHCPVYSSWKLTMERIEGNIKRCKSFFPDTEIREEDRVTNDDYKGSGWSRGHMCPAGDNKDSQLRMQESCLLTNICPQDMSLNNGDWNELENKCRSWARKGYGPIYIVCGPLFNSNNCNYIGRNIKIRVPDGFYKVVLLTNYTSNEGNTPYYMMGFLYPNHSVNNPVESYNVSVDDIESITGIDFFPSLPDDIEDALEKVRAFATL